MGNSSTIPIINKIPGEKYSEGYIHEIFKDGPSIYKIAKHCFLDYASYTSVSHELYNMDFLAKNGFLTASDYQVFFSPRGYGLKMSFIQGVPVSTDNNHDALFASLLKRASAIIKGWAGPPDNHFNSWSDFLSFSLFTQVKKLDFITSKDFTKLNAAICNIRINSNSLLFIDANQNNVILHPSGDLYLIDMDRIILGDCDYQEAHFCYQRGDFSINKSNNTFIHLLYYILIVLEDISFRAGHKLEYREQYSTYKYLMNLYNSLDN